MDYADNFEKENILEYIEDLFIYVDEKYKKRWILKQNDKSNKYSGYKRNKRCKKIRKIKVIRTIYQTY